MLRRCYTQDGAKSDRRPLQWNADTGVSGLWRLRETIAVWVDRSRKRRQLARFTPHQMKDLAISRLDVMREINKPFWRP